MRLGFVRKSEQILKKANLAEAQAPHPRPIASIRPAQNADQNVRPAETALEGIAWDFEDYLTFQRSQATSADLESLVTFERALQSGERIVSQGFLSKWIIPLIVGGIGLVVVVYLLKTLGIVSW